MSRIIGYQLSGTDNGSYLLSKTDGVERCNVCGVVRDFDQVNCDFKVTKKKFDFSYTYDNRCVVSKVFMEYFTSNGIQDLQFKSISSTNLFYLFIPTKIVEYDFIKRKTRFENFCNTCGRYLYVVGATPVFLKSTVETNNIYKSDLYFGSGSSKSPLIIAGCDLAADMKKIGLTGITFNPVFDDGLGN